MMTKITKDVLESYLNCKYKGHLKLAGDQGTKADYETLLSQAKAEVRLAVIEKILAQHSTHEVERNVRLSAATLRPGPVFVFDAILDDDRMFLSFDGLKKVNGPSNLGDFHYIPMLFHEGRKIGKSLKLLLELYGLLLSKVQGRIPSSGIVWCGKECRATKIRLNLDSRTVQRLLRELREMAASESLPALILNEHCSICEFRQRCHDQAVREDNLSLLRGMGVKETKKYARKGILTLSQLAHTFRPRRKPTWAAQASKKRYHALQAMAIRDKRIYVFGSPEIPTRPVSIYLDVESTAKEQFVYLIGIIVVESGSEKRYSLWADNKAQEHEIFEEFLAVVGQHDDFLVFCYGAYERAFLKRMQRLAKRKKLVKKVLNRLVNALSLIYSHVYFPTHTNGLKEVGGCLGCTWTEADASGIQSMAWRMRWEATQDVAWKQKLMTYNMEDCAALKTVTDVIYAIAAKNISGKGQLAFGKEAVPVSLMQDVDKLAHYGKWGRVSFHHADYEIINNCAYFDYQRDRVYARSSPRLRKNLAKRAGMHNRRVRVSKCLRVVGSRCPLCMSKEITTALAGEQGKCPKPRVKRAFDLVFTSGGIKRKVIECRTSVHQCLKCGQAFIPDQHQRLDKHFHGLKSWAMFQHVAHRLSFVTIQGMFNEFFGLHVHDSEIHMFKSLMVRYYRSTYRDLLAKIVAGNLMHVDETAVKLQVGKGYVWVFTNLEEVVFMYRPTREGEFLRKLLRDFKGVLVSDFYTAYDSLDCPKQKCLIHLLRDMNQGLLNNPYDEELQLVTRPFGSLLRAVVATVDEHGLKKKYLQRQEQAVAKFFQQLTEQSFRSEAAEALRERLLKYRDKLFTFLQHDGVPWNNNNAENAIKRFAYYRENTVGSLRETGLSDYLVLLSICHTCRYKGVSFLKFLLSRERNVDAFCESKRSKRRPPAIEVYPKGSVPPHFRNREKARVKQEPNQVNEVSEMSIKQIGQATAEGAAETGRS
jgi:predicted RecB family nuclease